MNICYISWEYPPEINGGVAVYIKEIALAMRDKGNNVFVITKSNSEDSEGFEDGIFVLRLKPKRLKIISNLKSFIPRTVERLEFSNRVSKKLKYLTKDKGIDIVESAEAYSCGFMYYLFRKKPPLVIKLHTPEGIIFKWNRESINLDIKFLSKMEEFLMLRAKKLICITDSMRDIIKRFYGFNIDSAPKVYNPFNIRKISSATFSEKDDSVLYVGRLEFRKGVHLFIEAIPKILKDAPFAKFIIIGGDCGMRGYIDRKIEEYSCRDKIILLDALSREEIYKFYNSAKIFVLPSLWENFPYVLLEAMAYGCCVVAANNGGALEIIEDGKNGCLFKTGSSIDLADKVIRLLKDKDLSLNIAANAKDSITNITEPEHIAEETLNIYKSLLCDDKKYA